MTASTTATLAAFISDMECDALPAVVVERVQRQVLDLLGVALAGSREDAARLARSVIGPGGATVWGCDQRAGEADAAFVNGIAAHALDFDDMWLPGAHPSAPIVPAALAVAEARHSSGRDLVAALAVGYELMGRLHSAVGSRGGWHPTGVFGTFGAVAACSRLLGLPADRTATAIGIATSMTGGVDAHEGTMTKPLHAGHAAHGGVRAATLAAAGFTASRRAFDGPRSFFPAFFPTAQLQPWRLTAGLGQSYHLVTPGIGIKMYPAGYYLHHTFEATLRIVERADLGEADVADVQIGVRPGSRFDRPAPTSPLDAKFSLQYMAATAIVTRRLTIDSFTPEAVSDAAVRAVMDRVRVYRDTELTDNRDIIANPVTIRCRDGRVLTEAVDRPQSHWAYELPRERWLGKFHDNVRDVVPAHTAHRVVDVVDNLVTLDDVAVLGGLLRRTS